MKLAISVQHDGNALTTCPRFGRADAFLLVDLTTGDRSTHENAQNLQAAQGAGIQAAQAVARLGADAVLTGHIGPKAFKTLEAAGIDAYTGVQGSVDDAIAQFESGALTPAASADVEGHWT